MTRPPLVLAVHGTRSALGTRTSMELAEAVADASGADVRLGWVDIHTPTLTDTLRELGEAIIVPAFLTSGYHVTSDIPAAITAAGARATATPLVWSPWSGGVSRCDCSLRPPSCQLAPASVE